MSAGRCGERVVSPCRKTQVDMWSRGEEVEHGDDNEGEAEDDVDHEYLEQEYGHRKIKPMLDPKLPCQEEVRQHYLTHMPYRNWCPHCARGRGKGDGAQEEEG